MRAPGPADGRKADDREQEAAAVVWGLAAAQGQMQQAPEEAEAALRTRLALDED